MSDEDLDLARLARGAPSAFAQRTIELPPAAVLNDDSGVDWEQAIVFVTAGEIELVCATGPRARFRRGAIICFAPFLNRTIRNSGTDPARLLAIWRQATDL
jgi:glyoxylate utilization-related uncharacterized protein